jgi:hypothetical protein
MPTIIRNETLSLREDTHSEPEFSAESKTQQLSYKMHILQWVVFSIILALFIAYTLYIKYFVNPQDEENPRRGRIRRRRRALEWLCPRCQSLMEHNLDDERTALLVRRECLCGTRGRGRPPSYGARDQLPKYRDGDMAPAYEP